MTVYIWCVQKCTHSEYLLLKAPRQISQSARFIFTQSFQITIWFHLNHPMLYGNKPIILAHDVQIWIHLLQQRWMDVMFEMCVCAQVSWPHGKKNILHRQESSTHWRLDKGHILSGCQSAGETRSCIREREIQRLPFLQDNLTRGED